MPYNYVSSMPSYRDPDTAAAENLIIASSLLQDIGRGAEAESLADQARALFEDVPFDKKKQARVLGRAVCLPDGVLQCRINGPADFYEVASYGYDDGGEAEAAKREAGTKNFRKASSNAVLNLGLGWLASAQLSSALSGKPMRAPVKPLAKAMKALCGAAAASRKAGWSPEASGAFRDAMRKSRLLDDALGSYNMRCDAQTLSMYRRVGADEGSPSKNGGWILWFPPDALSSLATKAERLQDAQAGYPDIQDVVRDMIPYMRGAWYPVGYEWERRETAERIAEAAVREASEITGIPMDDLERMTIDTTSNIDTALCRAMHAKRLADAYLVFQEAARRDEGTKALFLKTGFLSASDVTLPDGPGWYADVAAAVLESGWQGYNRYTVRGERCTGDPLTSKFQAAALETSRAAIREWFRSPEAGSLFGATPGAYKNCPDPDKQQEEKGDADENRAKNMERSEQDG